MPSLPLGVVAFQPENPWSNAHQNFKNQYTPGASYSVEVPGVSSTIPAYNTATANIQWIIKQAIDSGTTLRAIGNNWSFSEVAMCNGGMINTKGLNLHFRLGNSSLVPAYLAKGKTKEDVIFL